MNLTHRYSKTKDKLYCFEIVKNNNSNRFNIAVYKWSRENQKHIFEDHINSQVYVSMLDESDIFDSFFHEGPEQERSLTSILSNAGVKYIIDNTFYYDGANNSFEFCTKEDAEKGAKILQDIFKYVSP